MEFAGYLKHLITITTNTTINTTLPHNCSPGKNLVITTHGNWYVYVSAMLVS